MLRKLAFLTPALVFALAAMLLVTGCNPSINDVPQNELAATPLTKNPESRGQDKSKEDHGHKAGAHGGIIVALGRDSYHAEAVFEKGGLLKLFTLGKDEAKIIDVETQTLQAYVKEDGAGEAVEMELHPTPRAGDKAGRTSQFVGKLPNDLAGKQLAVTIPIMVVNGERFRIGFTSAPATHDASMPSGVGAAEEKELYLKPGGIYTLADIKANGNVTASQKFRGISSKHDMRPKVGDKICPVTMTKANPKFAWTVAGKSYEFCCPPCVDEFVTWAKTQPELVKEPASYVKQK